MAYPINLRVNAPNQIFVRGRGLDAELGGSLLLTGTTANLVPQGQFDLIRGRLDLLGRRLDLTDGSVSLRGSFDPYVRFGASTQVEDTMITIRIEGFASEPDLRVTSDPELPEDEALSFFLFGRSVTNLSPLQAVQLAAAVRTLSGQGGLGLTENLRSGLGVDNLDIGTDADGNAQATVGKYLSDNIYTDVTVGSDGTSQINLNLQVNPNVTVRGRVGSDGDTGLGVFFERDY
ncbi:translocation/assembly module TamB domain-containing protein [Ponticoccus litoralis]|uniref:Translocation/assembly module TamB domain-containing protein n=1 Tax=Ponticoccus litoralis TaxID=422297 RepID=A0AAW9SSF7_9RHOB